MNQRPKLFLIDGSSYIYRAYFALPYLSNSAGMPTNAIYGFTQMLIRVVKDHKPAYLAMVLDAPGPTFRHEVYEAYKANRPSMPEELTPQIPYIKEITKGFRIPILEKQGYEADDIIGTMVEKCKNDADIIIVSGDKDMMQLVSEGVTVLDTMKDKVCDQAEVGRRFEVNPSQLIDVFGLSGDTSDNVPGVPGIGEKTAVKLIKEFGSIDALFKNVDKVAGEKLRENLKKYQQQALLSKELVRIRTDVPLFINLPDVRLIPADNERLKELFKELEFNKFVRELTSQKTISYDDYHVINRMEDVEKLIRALKTAGEFSLDLETTSLSPMEAEIVGISFSWKEHQACYIPVAHQDTTMPQLERTCVLSLLQPLLEDEKIRIYGQNIKYDYIILQRYGIIIRGIAGDTMIASYLLNPTKHNHNLEEIALEYLDHQMITYKDLTGTGKKALSFDRVGIEEAKVYSCEDADVTFLLAKLLLPKLEEEGLSELFYQVEMPLVEVLAKMEMNGVKIDVTLLQEMSQEFESLLNSSMEKIYGLAGEEFNINSPQQLGNILFEKLKLPGARRTKIGYSTDVETLQKLAPHHPLPAEVLAFRSLSKLKSTYIDAFPRMINLQTGRLHTSYNQTVTATGRLSSSDPNLQNIPIRSPEGRRIREAFIADRGRKILSADYSQIELRILAHLSQDETLRKSFREGEDIHTRTAAEIFGVSPHLVTPEMRREAKVINFGIIYGMSAYGLAKELGIDQKIAKAYITDYFKKYRGVREYIDSVLEKAREKGYVTTLKNRRRYLPEITSSNQVMRQFAERMAINAPIQGTAADLIKSAMITIQKRIEEQGMKTNMVIQIHDELVFEVPEEELQEAEDLVRHEMEGVIDISVPLKIDISSGKNWSEAH
ncbi:MAG: DNA polymerase I [Proteobacteria bacterium]|nr:DNA polymerase I [Pseudomonadota bacterium]